jgi:polyisoprenoid-binding protein YceI
MSVAASAREWLQAGDVWTVDPVHSAVQFRVRYLMLEIVKGQFRDFDGEIVGGSTPSFSGSLRVASLETLDTRRDDHLRSAEFFDAERHPHITFSSSEVEWAGDELFTLPGELTIKGVTRPINMGGTLASVEIDPDGVNRLAVALRGRIDRSDYGLVRSRTLEAGGVLVGNDVDLLLDVTAVRVD